MKILYLIHNDKDWIKQRSHYFREELLRNKIEIIAIFKYQVKNRSKLSKKNERTDGAYNVILYPFSKSKNNIIFSIFSFAIKLILKIIIKIKKIDAILYTHPLFYDYLPSGVKLIYDLHDDNELFYSERQIKKQISNNNTKSLECSNVIFSSEYLYAKYNKCVKNKKIIIRNGHNLKAKNDNRVEEIKKIKKIIYFGTISEWFDFDTINYILKNLNIEVNIIGPSDVVVRDKLFGNYKIIGSMNHSDLIDYCINNADAYIMPFKVTELIRGVDPLKIYEYLALGKPVFSIYYDELKHFDGLVNFYKNNEELVEIIKRGEYVDFGDKINDKKREQFVENSSWENRTKELIKFVDVCLKNE